MTDDSCLAVDLGEGQSLISGEQDDRNQAKNCDGLNLILLLMWMMLMMLLASTLLIQHSHDFCEI